MQGKLNIYASAPNLSRLRSRVEKPGKELTGELRKALNEAVVEVLNKSVIDLRAALIKRVAGMNLKYKSKAHELQVTSLVNSVFDTHFATTAAELKAFVGAEESTEEGEDEEPVDEEEDEAPEGEPASDDFDE